MVKLCPGTVTCSWALREYSVSSWPHLLSPPPPPTPFPFLLLLLLSFKVALRDGSAPETQGQTQQGISVHLTVDEWQGAECVCFSACALCFRWCFDSVLNSLCLIGSVFWLTPNFKGQSSFWQNEFSLDAFLLFDCWTPRIFRLIVLHQKPDLNKLATTSLLEWFPCFRILDSLIVSGLHFWLHLVYKHC